MLILVQRRPWRDGVATPVRISFDPQIRGFLRKGIPGMVANAGPQFLIVGGAIIASSTPAAVSWLYFANRLIELPLGMVGVAMGTVLVPELTRAIRNDDRDAVMQAESRGAELATALVLPAALGLILLNKDFKGEPARVQVVRTLAKVPGTEAVEQLTAYIESVPANPPRQSRREAESLVEQRLTGGN